MLTEVANKELKTAPANPETEIANEESAPEETGKGNWREAFLSAFQTARRQQKPGESRQELGRDKSKSLFVLVGVCVALLLLFLGIFSRPKQKISLPGENPRGEASLGRKVTPGQENSDPNTSVTPKLSADVRSADPDGRPGQVGKADQARALVHGGAVGGDRFPLEPTADRARGTRRRRGAFRAASLQAVDGNVVLANGGVRRGRQTGLGAHRFWSQHTAGGIKPCSLRKRTRN